MSKNTIPNLANFLQSCFVPIRGSWMSDDWYEKRPPCKQPYPYDRPQDIAPKRKPLQEEVKDSWDNARKTKEVLKKAREHEASGINIIPDKTNYIFEIDLPGFAKQEIRVSFDRVNGDISVIASNGKRPEVSKIISGKLFKYQFAKNVNCSILNGVLKIEFPKYVEQPPEFFKIS